MAPPRNTRRRSALADAAIEVLGTAGIHKLSHRAVDERAGLPAGTAANYFPRRDDLLAAAARHRTRYLAAYELALESTRQPALAEAMSRLGATALGATLAEHRVLGLPTTPEQVQALIALYNGTLLTLVIAPPETVTPEATLALARCL